MRKLLALPALLLVPALALSAAATGSPSAPPPTPVPQQCPSGVGVCVQPSPFPTSLATPPPSLVAPRVHAAAAILVDMRSGQVLLKFHPDLRRPIASVTKIMTALLVVERARPDDVVEVRADAALEGSARLGFSELGLRRGEHITIESLLYALMLQSANDAAIALADHVAGNVGRFVQAMNREAKELGLARTRFHSPNGLDDRGYSTARGLAVMTREAFTNGLFARVARTKFHDVPRAVGAPSRVQNRNALLWLYPAAIGVKTGYTSAAGFCLVAAARRNGTGLVAVILGAPTGQESFSEAATLLDYGFHAFVRATVGKAGAVVCCLRIGHSLVKGRMKRPVTVLVPANRPDRPVLGGPRARPGLKSVPETGRPVGSVPVRLGGKTVASVPLVSAGRAGPAPPRPGATPPAPWWRRGLDVLHHAASNLLHAVFG